MATAGQRPGAKPLGLLDLDIRVSSVLAEARQAYVGITSGRAPHVTPVLFAITDSRLWFLAASRTQKARSLRPSDPVAVLARAGPRSVALLGGVERHSATDLRDVVHALRSPMRTGRALAALGVRNAADAVGFASDIVRGRTVPSSLRPRVLFGFFAETAVLFDGLAEQGHWGAWPWSARESAIPAEGDSAVAGISVGGKVAVLPARWSASGSTSGGLVFLPALGLEATRAPLCLVQDEYQGPGPAAKLGTMLRGQGELIEGRWHLTVERSAHWGEADTATDWA